MFMGNVVFRQRLTFYVIFSFWCLCFYQKTGGFMLNREEILDEIRQKKQEICRFYCNFVANIVYYAK